MPATARAVSRDELEALLRLKKLDHTLTPLEPLGKLEIHDRWCLPTGIGDLDERLQGGMPRGHLSEVVGARSSGRLAVMLSALAGATRRGEAVAFIDPLDMFDPPSAAASGVDCSRLLWIRGEASSSARVSLSCEYGTLQKSLDRAVKSLNLVLQAGGFGLVVLDLADMPSQVLRRLPFTTWLRLHRVLEGSETACVLIGAAPISRSAGGVSVHVAQDGWKVESLKSKVESRKSEAYISARIVRGRAAETPNVCLPVSAAAC